jgi:hypothetical protein
VPFFARQIYTAFYLIGFKTQGALIAPVCVLKRFTLIIRGGSKAIPSSRRKRKKVGLFPTHTITNKQARLGRANIPEDNTGSPSNAAKHE